MNALVKPFLSAKVTVVENTYKSLLRVIFMIDIHQHVHGVFLVVSCSELAKP